MSRAHSPCFRNLYEQILGYDDARFSSDVLTSWLREHGACTADWFAAFAARRGNPFPELEVEELNDLYAFSRVNDALRLDFQPFRPQSGAPESWRDWFGLTLDDYHDFVTRCGLETPPPEPHFTPFSHEIVTVEQSPDDDAPIELTEELWPAVMAGQLLISRAGVCVSAGRTNALKEVAENSTLYWARLRRNRKCVDLSLGWGSNSQWATSFRRDYRADGLLALNVDGRQDVANGREGDARTVRQRFEHLAHRCLMTAAMPHDHDLWPYEDRFIGTDSDLQAALGPISGALPAIP